jgi:hypothetical protein
MTLPPLRDPVTYWSIAIDHEDMFNGWPVKSWPGEVYVSAKGFPTVRSQARFETESDAKLFLETNRTVVERRCANKFGFHGFVVCSGGSLWPVEYDQPVLLGRGRESRGSAANR